MWGGLRHDVVGRMVGFQLQISAVSLGANAVLSVGAALCVAATAGLRSAAKCTAVPLAGGESDDSTTPVTTPGSRGHDSGGLGPRPRPGQCTSSLLSSPEAGVDERNEETQ